MEREDLLRRYAQGKRDFSKVNLSGVNLAHTKLSGSNFIRANLQGANLPLANLSGAFFSYGGFKPS